MSISASMIEDRLHEVGEDCRRISLGLRAFLLVTSHGGRVYGPFVDGSDRTGWVAPDFMSPERFRPFYDKRDWNTGGERLWISPELAYLVGDRTRFWETFAVPKELDPGRYELSVQQGRIALFQEIVLPRGATGGACTIGLKRCIEAAGLPPWGERPGVVSAGFVQTIATTSSDTDTPVVPWIVRQVVQGGQVIIPVDPGARATTMFGAPGTSNLMHSDGALRMQLDGKAMFKVGIPARHSFGQIAYLLRGEPSSFILYRFDNDRQGIYHDEPPDQPGSNGYSTFVFQDDGALGSYGELEFVGTDRGRDRDDCRSGTLSAQMWVAVGGHDAVCDLARSCLRPPLS